MAAVEDGFWWYRGMRRIARVVVPRLYAAPGARVLDAGCGTGANLLDLRASWSREKTGGDSQPAAFAGIGVDLSMDAVWFCRSRKTGPLARATITRLPFPDATFDFLHSRDVLVSVEDDEGALRELFRVCKPGGALFLGVAALPVLRGEHDRAVQSIRRYGKGELREKLSRAGFLVERVTFANFLLCPTILAHRLLRRALKPAQSDAEAVSDFAYSGASAGRGALNALLYRVLCLESWLLRFVNLPFGVTLMALAKRPA